MSDRTPQQIAAASTDRGWDAKELLVALALRHVRLVPETPYGAELCDRINANVGRIVGVKEKTS